MSILSPAFLAAAGLVLLASAAAHLRDPRALSVALGVQRMLPAAARRPVAAALAPVELAVGMAVLAGALGLVTAGWARLAGLGAALLCAAFTGYLLAVLRSRPADRVPCGCGVSEAPVGGPAVVRAGVLSVMAGVGALTADGWTALQAPASHALVVACAASTLAVATALLPAARLVSDDLALTAPVTGGAR